MLVHGPAKTRPTPTTAYVCTDVSHALIAPFRRSAKIGDPERWDQKSRDFAVVRSAVAVSMVTELVMLLGGDPFVKIFSTGFSVGNDAVVVETPDILIALAATFGLVHAIPSSPSSPDWINPCFGNSVKGVLEGFSEWGVEAIQPWKNKTATIEFGAKVPFGIDDEPRTLPAWSTLSPPFRSRDKERCRRSACIGMPPVIGWRSGCQGCCR